MNFYEKALFVKPTWRLLLGAECKASNALRAMLLSALSVSLPLGGSVHYGIRLDSGSGGWTKFAWRSHLL
jgi:hypothetical protein